MTLPNFLIIGAGKSGTTALYQTLKQHPDVFMSQIKEPTFFVFYGAAPPLYQGPGDDRELARKIFSLKDYLDLFKEATYHPAIGEASCAYLSHSEVVAPRIREMTPDIKLIAVLRHPAERAYSKYQDMVRSGRETLPFEQALAAEKDRLAMNWIKGWGYKANGYYYKLLRPYFDLFPREQIRIFLYEDWKNHPQQMLQEILNYLGVQNPYVPPVVWANITRLPRSRKIHQLLTGQFLFRRWLRFIIPSAVRQKIMAQLLLWNSRKPPPLDPEIRCRLTQEFREDILKLQDLIHRDLSHWLAQ